MLPYILESLSEAEASPSCELWTALWYLSLMYSNRVTLAYGKKQVIPTLSVVLVQPEDLDWLEMTTLLADSVGYSREATISLVEFFSAGEAVRLPTERRFRPFTSLSDYVDKDELNSFLGLKEDNFRQLFSSLGFCSLREVTQILPSASRHTESRIWAYSSRGNSQLPCKAIAAKLAKLHPSVSGRMHLDSDALESVKWLEKKTNARLFRSTTKPFWGETYLVLKTMKVAMLLACARSSLIVTAADIRCASNLLTQEMIRLQAQADKGTNEAREAAFVELKKQLRYSSVWGKVSKQVWLNLVNIQFPELDAVQVFYDLHSSGLIKLSGRHVIPVRGACAP